MRSHKQGFCIAPTDGIDLLLPNAVWRPDGLGFTQCGSQSSIWVRETLPVGWGDTYSQSVAGQAFDITQVPNGRYYIEVAVNPRGLLYESNRTNNVTLREVILKGTAGNRTIEVPPWHGIDSEGCPPSCCPPNCA